MDKIRIRTELFPGTVPATKNEFARNFEIWCPKPHSSTLSCILLHSTTILAGKLSNPIFCNLLKCLSFKGKYKYICVSGGPWLSLSQNLRLISWKSEQIQSKILRNRCTFLYIFSFFFKVRTFRECKIGVSNNPTGRNISFHFVSSAAFSQIFCP